MPGISEEIFRDIQKKLPSIHHDVPETTTGIHWFLHGLVRLHRPEMVLEIGTCHGDATCYLVRAVVENGLGQVVGYESNAKKQQTTQTKVKSACGEDAPYEQRGAFPLDTEEIIYADFVFLDLDPKKAYFDVYERLCLSPGGYLISHDLTYAPDAAVLQSFSQMLVTSNIHWEIMHIPQERGLIVARRM